MQHSELGQRAEWKWGGEGRKRHAPTGAGASLALAWSLSDGRSRVNTGDASVSFQFWASCFGLPILNSALKASFAQVSLDSWMGLPGWDGGCSQALLLKLSITFPPGLSEACDSTALGAKQLLLSWLFAFTPLLCFHSQARFSPCVLKGNGSYLVIHKNHLRGLLKGKFGQSWKLNTDWIFDIKKLLLNFYMWP